MLFFLFKHQQRSNSITFALFQYYKIFDDIISSTSAWDHWYKVFNMEKEAIGIINKYKETFDLEGSYRYVYDSHDMLALVGNMFLIKQLRNSNLKAL